MPYALQQKVEEERNRLQKEGIMLPVENSESAAPTVTVRKAYNSTKICGDYKVTKTSYQSNAEPTRFIRNFSWRPVFHSTRHKTSVPANEDSSG